MLLNKFNQRGIRSLLGKLQDTDERYQRRYTNKISLSNPLDFWPPIVTILYIEN